jgi:uracil-DNA glycosylase
LIFEPGLILLFSLRVKFSGMDVKIEDGWKTRLAEEFRKEYFEKLISFVREEYKIHRIYPPGKLIFNAFDQCPFDNLKVVILGQDPYHGPGQAHGLCFSVNDGIPFPPSLKNIFKELKDDVGKEIPRSGDLTDWARQGVLLLNATLTVRAHQAGSHQNKGWETFTDAAIQAASDQKEHLVFLLWGNYAISKRRLIDESKHLVLTSVHPSPLSASRGFFGNKHFSKANNFLTKNGLEPINW